jgi:hypothetical protein
MYKGRIHLAKIPQFGKISGRVLHSVFMRRGEGSLSKGRKAGSTAEAENAGASCIIERCIVKGKW